jgi:aminoglycoside phosphotransferase (APT) family kinase protein
VDHASAPAVADAEGDGALIAVRPEDAFDVAAVHLWLSQRLPGLVAPPEVLQFRGGQSNLTYLLRYPGQELVLRRPPHGKKAGSAHDMRREYEVQRLLRGQFPQVCEVLAFGDDPWVLPEPFYVMKRVQGLILRRDLPPDLDLSPAQTHELGVRIFDVLADLHNVDVDAAGLRYLWRGEGYVGRQVSGWSRRYRDAQTPDVPDGEDVMRWLDHRQPADVGARMIHGDWRCDNLVLDPSTLAVTTVLDWELATVGDPLMDLGCALAYWVQADDDADFQELRFQPSNAAGMPTRAEILGSYTARTGLDIGDWSFYEVFGLFRLAVVLQQIWYRYRAGQTTNPDFAGFAVAVDHLIERCRQRLHD